MPGHHPAITALQAEYEQLAQLPFSALSPAQRTSVGFYLADIGADPHADGFVRRWADSIHEIDDFVAGTGHLPRSDSTRPRPRTIEQQLVDWLAYQRRDTVRRGMCDYQERRLEALPGFQWAPHVDVWRDTLQRHQDFWRDNGHAPRRRSNDKAEVALGRWVAHQRAAHRAGTLRPDRERLLRAASHRVI